MEDKREFLELANLAYEQVVEYSGNRHKKYVVFFKGLIDGVTQKSDEFDGDFSKVSLGPIEVAEIIGRKPEDHEFERKHINKNLWPPLLETLEEIQPSINTESIQRGYRKRLVPVRVSGEKNRVSYGIQLENLSDQELNDSNVPSDDAREEQNVINYRLAKLPRPSFIGSFFKKMSLDGYRRWVYFSIPAIPFFILFFWFEYILFTQSYSQWASFFLMLVCFGAVWLAISPFYTLLDRRISMAPAWMLRFNHLHAQIEMRKIGVDSRKQATERELRFVVYEAECPICGGSVEIINGRKKYRGRLIGQCQNNGVEHIFSFDQVTKKGVPLRRDTYHGSRL